jgi:2'-5' RNA ligase
MIRSFISFDINDTLRDDCISLIYKGKGLYLDQIKWVNPENLHLTFLFLGDIGFSDKDTVIDLIGNLVSQLPPLSLYNPTLKWNPPFKPMQIWIEYSCDDTTFDSLRKTFIYHLKQELPYLKLDNKDFKWHLTLGRVRQQETKKIDISKWVFTDEELHPTLSLSQISLYQSILQPYGPTYKSLASFPLKGGK